MITGNMHHAADSMNHVLWHGDEEYAELPPFFVDSLELRVEQGAWRQDTAALEDAWLSLRMHFETAPGLEEAFH